MRYSKLFGKTIKQVPKDSETANHRLLVQAGYVDQLMAGVYTYLPLGLRVLRNIEQIVREEMDKINGQEVLMPILHPKVNWVQTGGWDNIEVLFKIQSRTEKEYALGQSEEEVVTPLIRDRVFSYKDLPIAVYQIHWKYRDELRAKAGILRGREFFMKDMYSFHTTEEDFQKFYQIVKKAYLNIYKRLGLVAKVTEASGGAFSTKISYEFMVLTEAGEDDILYCQECDFCVNIEIAKVKEGDKCHLCGCLLSLGRASEVGNVFDLGQKYSKDFNFQVSQEDGSKIYPFMGCYGIGISRAMGVIVEKFNDEKGIVWPSSVAPFQVHLIGLDLDDKNVSKEAENIYNRLQREGVEVLFDDRIGLSAGAKFADSDLIGVPYRVVISKRTAGKELEFKKRSEKETHFLKLEDLIAKING